jgi:hypothetical protein
MISDGFHFQEPFTSADIIDAVEYEFGKEILFDPLRHVIYRTKGVKFIQGKPMERERVHRDTELIDLFYEDRTRQLDSVPQPR